MLLDASKSADSASWRRLARHDVHCARQWYAASLISSTHTTSWQLCAWGSGRTVGHMSLGLRPSIGYNL